jgi:hypothetical protein
VFSARGGSNRGKVTDLGPTEELRKYTTFNRLIRRLTTLVSVNGTAIHTHFLTHVDTVYNNKLRNVTNPTCHRSSLAVFFRRQTSCVQLLFNSCVFSLYQLTLYIHNSTLPTLYVFRASLINFRRFLSLFNDARPTPSTFQRRLADVYRRVF